MSVPQNKEAFRKIFELGTKRQLRKVAKENGLKNFSTLNKEQLVNKLLDFETARKVQTERQTRIDKGKALEAVAKKLQTKYPNAKVFYKRNVLNFTTIGPPVGGAGSINRKTYNDQTDLEARIAQNYGQFINAVMEDGEDILTGKAVSHDNKKKLEMAFKAFKALRAKTMQKREVPMPKKSLQDLPTDVVKKITGDLPNIDMNSRYTNRGVMGDREFSAKVEDIVNPFVGEFPLVDVIFSFGKFALGAVRPIRGVSQKKNIHTGEEDSDDADAYFGNLEPLARFPTEVRALLSNKNEKVREIGKKLLALKMRVVMTPIKTDKGKTEHFVRTFKTDSDFDPNSKLSSELEKLEESDNFISGLLDSEYRKTLFKVSALLRHIRVNIGEYSLIGYLQNGVTFQKQDTMRRMMSKKFMDMPENTQNVIKTMINNATLFDLSLKNKKDVLKKLSEASTPEPAKKIEEKKIETRESRTKKVIEGKTYYIGANNDVFDSMDGGKKVGIWNPRFNTWARRFAVPIKDIADDL